MEHRAHWQAWSIVGADCFQQLPAKLGNAPGKGIAGAAAVAFHEAPLGIAFRLGLDMVVRRLRSRTRGSFGHLCLLRCTKGLRRGAGRNHAATLREATSTLF